MTPRRLENGFFYESHLMPNRSTRFAIKLFRSRGSRTRSGPLRSMEDRRSVHNLPLQMPGFACS